MGPPRNSSQTWCRGLFTCPRTLLGCLYPQAACHVLTVAQGLPPLQCRSLWRQPSLPTLNAHGPSPCHGPSLIASPKSWIGSIFILLLTSWGIAEPLLVTVRVGGAFQVDIRKTTFLHPTPDCFLAEPLFAHCQLRVFATAQITVQLLEIC